MGKEFDYTLLKSCGEDVFISSNVEIKRPHLVTVGNHTAIDTGFYCTVKADIGDYIHIAPYVTAIGGEQGYLKMDHFSCIAAGGRIVTASDEYLGEGITGPTIPEKYKDKIKVAPVVFEKFAAVATDVIILPGVTLGEGSVIGAFSLVRENTEPWTIYAGIPAKPIKKRRKDIILKYAKELGYL
jgi:acetyltransferase-like isoleucine patch superfamily enzyme